MSFEFGNDLVLLSQLLNPHQKDDSDDDDKICSKSTNKYTSPADVTAIVKQEEENHTQEEQQDKKVNKEKEEWEDDYESKMKSYNTQNDWKAKPSFEISYRQRVSASDVFLQMSAKNPSTASCENMIVTVYLPGESRQNIDLKVLKDHLEINSPSFYLNLPLPQPVDPQQGNAQFDNDTENLIITLLMEREFDYINF